MRDKQYDDGGRSFDLEDELQVQLLILMYE